MTTTGRHVSKLSGYAPALPTPFNDEGNIDVAAFERLCDLQIANGATALVVCGTTGEAATLSPGEHRELIRTAVARSRGRGLRLTFPPDMGYIFDACTAGAAPASRSPGRSAPRR